MKFKKSFPNEDYSSINNLFGICMVPNLYGSFTLYPNPNLNIGLLMIEVRIGKNATNSSILDYNNLKC